MFSPPRAQCSRRFACGPLCLSDWWANFICNAPYNPFSLPSTLGGYRGLGKMLQRGGFRANIWPRDHQTTPVSPCNPDTTSLWSFSQWNCFLSRYYKYPYPGDAGPLYSSRAVWSRQTDSRDKNLSSNLSANSFCAFSYDNNYNIWCWTPALCKVPSLLLEGRNSLSPLDGSFPGGQSGPREPVTTIIGRMKSRRERKGRGAACFETSVFQCTGAWSPM